MYIVVELDGVIRNKETDPIATGIMMVGSLSGWNQITFLSDTTEEETVSWLNGNKVVDFDRIIDNSVYLANENNVERQIKVARSRGPIDLFITNNPKNWAYAFDLGIPSVMFGVPQYTRPEFRPDAPKRIRAWDEIEKSVIAQNELRTQDARLTRTETLNFE